MIEVDSANSMGPWRLRKHINLRHIPAGDFLTKHGDLSELSMRKCYRDDDAALRAFHEYCHRTNTYEHTHE